MATAAVHPVHALEHTHGHLSRLALEVGQLLRQPGSAASSPAVRQALAACIEELRHELLEHFANEEEGLFPFIRANVTAKTEMVDRLEAAHDAICGALVRLAHLAARDRAATPEAALLYERFENAYARHSREEAELFDELARGLTSDQQRDLTELLRGLA